MDHRNMLQANITRYQIDTGQGATYELRNFLPDHDTFALVDSSGNVFSASDRIETIDLSCTGAELVKHWASKYHKTLKSIPTDIKRFAHL